MSRGRTVFSFFLFLSGLVAGCSRQADRPPVVLISVDTLRADRLPIYGYRGVDTPAIDALARDAMVFDNAIAHYPLTLPSHLSLLTGLLPPRHGVRDNLGYPHDPGRHPGLARWLAPRGYRSGGFFSSYVLRGETGLGQEFTEYDGPSELFAGVAAMDLAQRPGAETAARAVAWLRTHREGPFVLFVHFYEPHAPYTPPPPFAGRYADPYDGEVAAADAAVGTVLSALRELGLYDRAAIALVSDHGEGLGDHGELQHGVFLYRSTLRVPFLLKLPGARRAGERVARPVGLVDVPVTLATLAGVTVPAGLDGVDLQAKPGGQETAAVYSETYYPRLHFGWSEITAWSEERWSLIDGPEPELFDLMSDPGQTRNQLLEQRREFARARAEIRQRNLPLTPPAAADAETAARLASLGYLTGGAVAGELPDPRSQREVLRQIEEGVAAFWSGRNEDSIRLLSAAVAANAGMHDVWSFLARALDRAGRLPEALRAWERVLELSGGDVPTALKVAGRHLDLGNLERAAAIAESVHGQDPESAEEVLTLVDLAAGREEAAERRMEAAVAAGVAGETMRRRLALVRLEDGDSAAAVGLLEPLRSAGEPASLTLLALALAAEGREQEGLPLLDRARTESARPAEFFENLGVVSLALGRLDRARAAFLEAVRLEPGLASAWNSLGVVAARSGDRRAAVEAWSRATAADPALLDAWFNLGLVTAELGDRATASAALRRFLAGARGPRYAADRARAERVLAGIGA